MVELGSLIMDWCDRDPPKAKRVKSLTVAATSGIKFNIWDEECSDF